MERDSILAKIVLLGDFKVGKTSIRRTYMGATFKEDHIFTLGAGFAVKFLDFENYRVELQIWDIGGQQTARTLLDKYLIGARGAFIVFDLTRKSSFEAINEWLEDLFKIIKISIPIVIIGNKIDLEDFQITKSEVESYIDKIENEYHGRISSLTYIYTSAKTGQNIDEAFEKLVEFLIHQ
ncbi:MAG: Rab family GTPase [Candidatus Kariarchaeaceae archaeon]